MADIKLSPAGFACPTESSPAFVNILKNTPKCAKIPTNYKAVRSDNGGWVEGLYAESNVLNGNGTYDGYILDRSGYQSSIPTVGFLVKVNPLTVCISIGEYDKDGVEIFTGDIISCNKNEYRFVVRYGKCGGVANSDNYGYKGFYLEPYGDSAKAAPKHTLRNNPLYWIGNGYAYVVGNIFDPRR